MKKSWRRKLLIILVAILASFAIVVSLLPVAIKMGGQSWLKDQGLEAEIKLVSIDIYGGVLSLEEAKGVNQQGKGFTLGNFLVEVNWLPLFDKELDIQRVEIAGLHLDTSAQEDGTMNIAGIPLPAATKDETTTPKSDSSPTPWSVLIRQISFSDIKICHSTQNVRQAITPLTLDQVMNSCLSLASMQWSGDIKWRAPKTGEPANAGIDINGSLKLNALLLERRNAKQTIFELGEIAINELEINGHKQVSTSAVELKNVKLLQQGVTDKQPMPYLLSWKALTIGSTSVDLEALQATIASISLNEMVAYVEYSKNGIAGIPGFPEKPTASKKTAQSKKTDLGITVDNIVVDGNNQVYITDKTVDPELKETISGINIKLSQLDSTKPGNNSPISIELKVGEYGQLNLTGTVQPFAKNVTVDLQQSIRNIDIANYSVYGKIFIGHRIKSGHLDIEQKLVIREGVLDIKSKIVLHKFEIEALKGEESKKYNKELGMPLSTALSLLRERDGSIHLEIPVTGDINKPDFSINDVLAKVTGKAVKEAIISYYTPYGLVQVMGGLVDLATGITFEPVVFAEGDEALDNEAKQQLEKMQKLFSNRPQLHLTLCGQPVRNDMLALYSTEDIGLESADNKQPVKLNEKQKSALLALLKTRMDAIKKHMIDQFGIDPGKIVLCSEPENTEWTLGVEAKPEISITLN